MDDVAVLGVALGVAYLPGLILLGASGLRSPLLLLGLAPAVSVTAAGVIAIICAVAGVAYGSIALAAAAACAFLVFLIFNVRKRRGQKQKSLEVRPRLLTSTLSPAVGAVMISVGIGYSAWTWMSGLGGLSTPPQEHDMIIHVIQTAYIVRSGQAAPWELVPADVLTGSLVSFYPSGFHLLAAATASLIGDVVSSVNAMTVVVLAIAWCLGSAALGFVASRQLGLGRGSAMLVSGLATLVAAGLYRPTFHLMHDGGILSNAAALAMLPGVIAGILTLPCMRWQGGAAVGLAAAGVVWVHPSAAVSIGVTVLAWWAGQATSAQGRRLFKTLLRPFSAAAAVGLVFIVPAIVPALDAAGKTGGFPSDTSPVSFRDAVGSTFGLPYSGWINQAQSQSQVWVVILLFMGIASVIALRRGLGPVAAWAAWSVITMGAWLSPGAGFEAPITAFFYNALLRIWSHIYILVPVLVGVGVVLVVNRLAVFLRRYVPIRATWSALAGAMVAFAAYTVDPAVAYAIVNETSVASRYSAPDFVRVDADDRRAIEWLESRVQPGERVLNSPNDGSTYLYVEAGIPIVNIYPLGTTSALYSYNLLAAFNTYPEDAGVRRCLLQLNVRWVYVDSSAPSIGSGGSPEGWAGGGGFSLAPGLQDLQALPGMQRVFKAGSVSVYALDLRGMSPTSVE